MKTFTHTNINFLVLFMLFGITCLSPVYGAARETATPTPSETRVPTPAPVDPDLKALQDKNAILDEEKKAAEARKAIAEAEAAEQKAKYPKPTTTPLEGKTELDASAKLETEIMGYSALKSVSRKIAEEIATKDRPLSHIAIYNKQTLIALQGYSATRSQLSFMKDMYDSLIAPKPVVQPAKPAFDTNYSFMMADTAIAAAHSIIGSVVDLIALMRTDTKITGISLTIDESTAVSELYRSLKLKSPDTKFYYPGEFPPNLNLRDYELLEKVEELYSLKAVAEDLIIKIEETEKKLKEEGTNKDGLASRKKQIPKDIAAAETELKKNQDVYKIKKFQSAELLEKIKDGENSIKKLKTELAVELPRKITENAQAIHNLELKLAELYSQIVQNFSADEVQMGYDAIAHLLAEKANRLIGKDYDNEQLKGLASTNDAEVKATKEAMIAAAKKHLGAGFTDAQGNEIANPISPDRLQPYMIISEALSTKSAELGNPATIGDIPVNEILTQGEQIKLINPTDSEAEIVKKVIDRKNPLLITQLKALNGQFDKFYQDIIKVDATTGVNPITSYLQTENLLEALECDKSTGACGNGTFLLKLNVIDVGGNNRTKKNLVTTFFTGDSVSHTGGAIVEYKLYDPTGHINASSVCFDYFGYLSARSVRSLVRKVGSVIPDKNQLACNSTTPSNVYTDSEASKPATSTKITPVEPGTETPKANER